MAVAAFIGLGVMGYPMAGHLAAKGHRVRVYNRTGQRAQDWTTQHDGTAHATPAEAAQGAEFVFACVGNDDDLRAVVHGEDGILAGMDEGTVFVDHTTASAEVAREIDAAAKEGNKRFIDAPVSGGQSGAEQGTLTIMCGGEAQAFGRVEEAMRAYGRMVKLMGPAGSGQLTKMVNQICIAGLVQALSEGMNFAQAAGLDTDKVIDVISKGAAQSWQMDNRAHTMCKNEFDFGFAVNWMRKDLRICLEEARSNGAPLPVTALVDQFYALVQQKGGARFDTSSLIVNLRDGER